MESTRKLQIEEVDNGFIVTTFKDSSIVTICVASTALKIGTLATEWAWGSAPVVDAITPKITDGELHDAIVAERQGTTEPRPIENMLVSALEDITSADTISSSTRMALAALARAEAMAAGKGG